MYSKSIRFKFIVWYTVILALSLSVFSLALYGSFSKSLYGNLDDLINSRAEGVADSVATYLQTMHDHDKGGFLTTARDWVEEKSKDPELMQVFVQILDSKGEPVVASKSMPHIMPLSKDDFDDIVKGEDSFDIVKGESIQGQKIKLRMYSKPVIANGKTAYIVQVVAPLDLLSLALNNLRFVLFLMLPLTVFLTTIPGMLLVRITLRPVDRMINTLRQITAENLKLKIHIPNTKDEIKKLADTFNDMIERLDRSFSSQQNFIQDISQELKIPLKDLRDELETALTRPRSPQDCENVLKRGLEEVDKFSKIIENLLTLARFDNNRMALEIKKVNLTKMIEETLYGMKPPAEEKDIILSSFLQDVITLDGDKNQLQRLLTNVMDNAIKYTHRKGKVTVTAHKYKTSAKIVISDTGMGIPEEELSYIFDRFYQVKKPRKLNGSFGLGLSTAKSILEAHKGTISVESQIGKGSTFTITLPLSYQA